MTLAIYSACSPQFSSLSTIIRTTGSVPLCRKRMRPEASSSVALYQILSGGLVFGAVFMATDYVTTPITRTGRMIFAFGCGLITFLIRFYGNYPEGVSFSILLMNILSPYIEKWTAKRPLGGKKA